MECNIQFFVRGSHGNWWTWKVLQNLTVFTDASFALLEVEAVPLPDPTPRGFHFEGKCSPPHPETCRLELWWKSKTAKLCGNWSFEEMNINSYEQSYVGWFQFYSTCCMLCYVVIQYDTLHIMWLYIELYPNAFWHCWRGSGWRWILWTSWGQRRRQHRAPSEWRKVSSRWNLLANGMNVLECCRLFKQIS